MNKKNFEDLEARVSKIEDSFKSLKKETSKRDASNYPFFERDKEIILSILEHSNISSVCLTATEISEKILDTADTSISPHRLGRLLNLIFPGKRRMIQKKGFAYQLKFKDGI